MNQENHLYLQGCDKLYVNLAKNVSTTTTSSNTNEASASMPFLTINSTLAEGRQWLTISAPTSYLDTNWPIKVKTGNKNLIQKMNRLTLIIFFKKQYSAIDSNSEYLAISGRNGLAYCSLKKFHWKLFGNEVQEKNFIVSGGLLWWRKYIVLGCMNLTSSTDEIRFYPSDNKLDNRFATIIPMAAPLLLVNSQHDYLITFSSNALVDIYKMADSDKVEVTKIQSIDASELCIHTVCVISITLMYPRNEPSTNCDNADYVESVILNITGKLVMVNCQLVSYLNPLSETKIEEKLFSI